ncbi:hypothetical protein A0H76_1968 [Hepatospora eriocheir]|uniref:Uncharacterized protein n=1 Tax=Hepatospora eriocheir TaxID=1081669 RepID=A0A1X0QGF1_9MICR|nr:hypothetical protein A0H76_1968 [Hepatospora eriocheir]
MTNKIIQIPKSISIDLLPEEIQLNVPFTINNHQYELIKSNSNDLKICVDSNDISIENEHNQEIKNVDEYFIIKRLI